MRPGAAFLTCFDFKLCFTKRARVNRCSTNLDLCHLNRQVIEPYDHNGTSACSFLKPPKMKKVNAVERSPNWDIN